MAVNVYGPKGHDNSGAEIIAWRSHDGGIMWPDEGKFVIQENIGRNNVKGPSFLRLTDRDVLFFFKVGNSHEDLGPWMRRSTDNTETWGSPERLPYDGYGGLNSNQALRLNSGRIILPCFVTRDVLETVYSYCFYSDDGGCRWERSNEITVEIRDPEKWYSRGKRYGGKTSKAVAAEPSVVQLKDGTLLMLMRTMMGFFYESRSGDGGKTWSEPVNSGIPAPACMPTLERVPDTGDLLLIYNHGDPPDISGPFPRTTLASLISRDEGKSFSHLRVIDGGPGFDGKITMASVHFLAGRALIVYSKVRLDEVPEGQSSNYYSWVQRIVPVSWFYEVDDFRS